jgi:DNA polymerase III subunit epsilon
VCNILAKNNVKGVFMSNNHLVVKERAIEKAKGFLLSKPVYIDTETTGFKPDDEIVDISIVDYDGTVLFNSLIKPKKKIPIDATNIHHITNEMVTYAPSWFDAWFVINQKLSGRVLGIYNEEYDVRLMKQSTEKWGINWNPAYKKSFCVMKLFADFYGEWDDYHGNYKWQKLEFAGKFFDINIPNSHRAKDDTLLTREVLILISGNNELKHKVKNSNAEIAREFVINVLIKEINFNNLGYVYQYEIALDVLRFLPRLDNILAENIISQPPLPRFRINYSNSLMIHKFNSLIENGHENIAINHIEIIDEITEILHVGREDELFNNLAILGGDSKYQQIILSFIFEKISKIMNSKILGYRKDYFIFKLCILLSKMGHKEEAAKAILRFFHKWPEPKHPIYVKFSNGLLKENTIDNINEEVVLRFLENEIAREDSQEVSKLDKEFLKGDYFEKLRKLNLHAKDLSIFDILPSERPYFEIYMGNLIKSPPEKEKEILELIKNEVLINPSQINRTGAMEVLIFHDVGGLSKIVSDFISDDKNSTESRLNILKIYLKAKNQNEGNQNEIKYLLEIAENKSIKFDRFYLKIILSKIIIEFELGNIEGAQKNTIKIIQLFSMTKFGYRIKTEVEKLVQIYIKYGVHYFSKEIIASILPEMDFSYHEMFMFLIDLNSSLDIENILASEKITPVFKMMLCKTILIVS